MMWTGIAIAILGLIGAWLVWQAESTALHANGWRVVRRLAIAYVVVVAGVVMAIINS